MDFTEFYQATSPRALRYAYGLTGDMAQAQDVVQEAYVRAWQRWRRLSAYDDAEGWLRLVVSRLALDWWRHLRVRRTAALTPPPPVREPSEDTVLVVEALKKLPDRQRQALALHYLLDISVAQIAAELDVSEGTVKSWLSRGLENLAALLGSEVPAAMPTADEVAERGRRRHRKRVAATMTAAGVVVVLVVVLVSTVMGRHRTAPPPTVTPTGSPIAFTPLQRIGAAAVLPSEPHDANLVVQDGRAYAVSVAAAGIQVAAVDLVTVQPAWPAITLPPRVNERFRAVVVPDAVAVINGPTTYVIDPATGTQRWQRQTTLDPDDIHFFPGVAVYADRAKGEAIGVDLATGQQRWQISTPIHRIFGMTRPEELDAADFGIGTPVMGYTSAEILVADGKGTITEYRAATGVLTGRAWHGVPPSDDYVAYNGDVFIRSAREVYRLDTAGGGMTKAYAGGGVIDIAPCGAVDVCVLDAAEAGAYAIIAVHNDSVKWRVPVAEARAIAPIGRSLRIAVGNDAGAVVLDENGRETLRVDEATRLLRLDAGNMLGVRQSRERVELTGIAVATMQQQQLGGVDVAAGSTAAANGSTVVTTIGREIVVYRIQ